MSWNILIWNTRSIFRCSYLTNPCCGEWCPSVLQKKWGMERQVFTHANTVNGTCVFQCRYWPCTLPWDRMVIICGFTMSSLFKQSLSAKYGGVFQAAGMLLCLSGVSEGVGVNEWQRAILKSAGQSVIGDRVSWQGHIRNSMLCGD